MAENGKILVSLSPSVGVAEYGGKCYKFEKRAPFPETVEIPRPFLEAVNVIAEAFNGRVQMPLSELSTRSGIPETQIQKLAEMGFFERRAHPLPEENPAAFDPSMFTRICPQPRFFNVPDFPLEQSDVAIFGLPLSFEKKQTLGVAAGYHLIREATMEYSWLNIHDHGFLNEAFVDGSPCVLGKGAKICDLGFLEPAGKPLGDVFFDTKKMIEKILAAKAKPLIIGGDHAVTFPVIWSMFKIDPKLTGDVSIVHLDAHHDFFFFDSVTYANGAPIYNILETTNVRDVRTFGIARASNARRETPGEKGLRHVKSGRLRQFGINKTMDLIRNPENLKRELSRSKKIYITIDIDVLAFDIVQGATHSPISTNHSMLWHDLYEFVKIVSESAEVIGCDFVEYSPIGRNARNALEPISLLLLLLIDVLRGAKIGSI